MRTSIILTCSLFIAAATTPHNDDPARHAMIAALGSPVPNAAIADGEARTWDRFVGAWDCDFSFHLADGSVRRKKGEVLFGWILDGNAIQDIWVTYPPDDPTHRSKGTSLRFYDPSARQWRVVFLSPQNNYVVTVTGGRQGDRIVLTGRDTNGADIRWSFNDIGPNSFVWHGETSRDGGKTWRLEEEHHMRRRL